MDHRRFNKTSQPEPLVPIFTGHPASWNKPASPGQFWSTHNKLWTWLWWNLGVWDDCVSTRLPTSGTHLSVLVRVHERLKVVLVKWNCCGLTIYIVDCLENKQTRCKCLYTVFVVLYTFKYTGPCVLTINIDLFYRFNWPGEFITWTNRRVSSTLRPTGRSFIVICLKCSRN